MRYGRYAIGARIIYNSCISQKASKSTVLIRAVIPYTELAVEHIFCHLPNSYVFLRNGHIFSFIDLQIGIPSILSFISNSSFINFQIVHASVTCVSKNILGRIYLRSRTCATYYKVPIVFGFSLRTTAIRFYAQSLLNYIRRNTHISFFTPALLASSFHNALSPLVVTKKDITVLHDKKITKTSFYENCIIEINKIASLGKRVFRNPTSSKPKKFAVGVDFKFIDDVYEQTTSFFNSRFLKRRQYIYRRALRISRRFAKNRYIFSRTDNSKRSSVIAYSFLNRHDVYIPKYVYSSVHKQRAIKYIIHFLNTIVLREKISLRIRAKYPFNTWLIKRGIVVNSYSANISFTRK